jgi:hypothetical protein
VEIINTFIANKLAFVLHQSLCGGTEHAVVLIFLEDDLVVFNEDFHLIVLSNIQRAPQLDGKDDSAQFIHLSDNSR